MTIKKQLDTLKQNWLLIVLVLALFLFQGAFQSISPTSYLQSASYYNDDLGFAPKAMTAESAVYRNSGDFAPEVEQRVIIKSASISTEVKRGTYEESETKLKNIINTADGFILNENVNTYGEGLSKYKNGYYSIRIETPKYLSVLDQLRSIGEVTSFNENAQDTTGTYTDLQTRLAAEKTRLQRYNQMYQQATEVQDKIILSDRIFEQERTIKYLEEAIENIDKRVDYSSISLTMTEKRSGYAGIALVKLSQLIKGLVNSFNNLLSLLFWAIPWIIGLWIVRWLWKRYY